MMEKDLRSFLTVALAIRLITRCITCAVLCKEGKILQFEAVARFEPSANGIGTVHSVAVTRRLIHGGGYLTDWTRKLLSLSGDARQSAWAAASHLDSAGSRTRLINTPCTRATMSAIWRCRERVLHLTYINIRLPVKG